MPYLTVGYEQFKRILGTGIKNNLSVIFIPTLPLTIGKIILSKKEYLAINPTFFGYTDSIAEITKIAGLSTIPLLRDLYSLVKASPFPAEGFDILTNSYWTRKTAGKINLNPLNLSFVIDDRYRIYDILNFVKDGAFLDKEHGVFNYPENYIIDRIMIGTFTPTVYSNPLLLGKININASITTKTLYNCIIKEVGEVSKDTSSKDTLEEFTVSIEYEHSKTNTALDLVDIAVANAKYILNKNGSIVEAIT